MDVARRGRPFSGTIGLIFGGLWGVLAALSLPAPWLLPGIVLAGGVSIALTISLWRRRPLGANNGMFRRGPYICAVVLEIVAIAAAGPLLRRYGLQAYFVEAVGLIVGLHFLGLWRATALSQFLMIAGGMCAVSVAAMALPHLWEGANLRDAVTGVGNAVILWIGAGRSVATGRARPSTQ